MFAEYGVDPHLIAAWANHPIGEVLRPLFGVSTGRLVSRFPKDWARTVRDIWDQEADSNKKKNIEILLMHLNQKLVSRNREQYLASRSWLENAEVDNSRVSFKKILSYSNPRINPNVIEASSLNSTLLAEFENRDGTFSIPKTTTSMVNFFSNLVRCAGDIKFVDKNFYPRTIRHTDPLIALLREANNRRPGGRINKIEYHVEFDKKGRHPADLNNYQTAMPNLLPKGVTIEFFFWEERLQWGLHNRYLLTDIGGFAFGMGLDVSPPREVVSDDISRLNAANLAILFNKFSANSQNPEIILKDKLTIVGQA